MSAFLRLSRSRITELLKIVQLFGIDFILYADRVMYGDSEGIDFIFQNSRSMIQSKEEGVSFGLQRH